MKVKDIGEQGLLSKLMPFCDKSLVGDDGAVLELKQQESLVVTTDLLVEGVHFSDRTTSPEDVGWRAAAANLSDLAAMGATPSGITVGLSLRGDVAYDWVEKLYQGLNKCLQKYHTSIIGGDICRSCVVTVAITALGQVKGDRVIRRSNAKVGDCIVVSGYHGASRAGLELLLNPETGQNLEDSEREFLYLAHQRPLPRLDVLEHLWQLEGVCSVAGMDSSDGLADAIIQICRMSGVGAEIDPNAIILPSALTKAFPEKALEWALYGGEDFEMVLCLPEKAAYELVKRLGAGAAVIGKITNSQICELNDKTVLSLASGFQHF